MKDKIKIWSRLRMSVAGPVNLVKMILMPQLLYILHNTPMVVSLKVCRVINSIFHSLIWHIKHPRIKLEQLQRPKESSGLALPNPWMYYLAAQPQHIARALPHPSKKPEASDYIIQFVRGESNVARGLEALGFSKSNKLFPTYVLMQKVCNKARQIQQATEYTNYSPIWDNDNYSDLKKCIMELSGTSMEFLQVF